MNPYEGLAIKPDGTKYKFAIAYCFLGCDWCVAEQGITESLLKRSGAEYISFNADLDCEAQVAYIEDLIAVTHPDGILAAPTDEYCASAVLDKAVKAGIPVSSLDRELVCEEDIASVYHDMDGKFGSNVVGDYFIKLAEETEKHLYLYEVWGDMATDTAQARHRGFHSAVDTRPDLITVAESGDTKWSDEVACSYVMDAFTAHLEYNAIYVHGGGSTGTVEALRSMGRLLPPDDPKHVVVVTNDVDTVVFQAVLDGLLDGCGTHQSWDLADIWVKLLFTRAILGQPTAQEVAIPMKVITLDNIYTAEGTVLGAPVYPLMPAAQWDLWPVLDSSKTGSLVMNPGDVPYALKTPTKEMRMELLGY